MKAQKYIHVVNIRTLRHTRGGWSHSSDTVTGGYSFDSFSIPHSLHEDMALKHGKISCYKLKTIGI